MYSMGPDGEGGGEGSECSVSMYSMGTDGEGGGEGSEARPCVLSWLAFVSLAGSLLCP